MALAGADCEPAPVVMPRVIEVRFERSLAGAADRLINLDAVSSFGRSSNVRKFCGSRVAVLWLGPDPEP